jgi:CBS domain-containing membrane protein
MQKTILSSIRRFFYVDAAPISHQEAWRSALGAWLGLGVTALVLYHTAPNILWLVAPIGATTVLLFLMPHSPASAPWSIIGGYLTAAVSSAMAIYLIPYPPIRAATAVALCIWLMTRLNCAHPSAGAAALLLTLGSSQLNSQWLSLLGLLTANIATLLLTALVINRLILRRRYPYHPTAPDPLTSPIALAELSISHADLDKAIRSSDSFIDVQENELLAIYDRALQYAKARQAPEHTPKA